MTIIIIIALLLAAIYCAVMYGWAAKQWLVLRDSRLVSAEADMDKLSDYSFRLALIGVLAAGFAGLLLK